jgi:hypothetical protein
MHVYRNRRYEEEIVMLMWHKEGEQRMVETSKQKTQIQAHHKFAESLEAQHRPWHTHRNRQKTTCTGLRPHGHGHSHSHGHGHGNGHGLFIMSYACGMIKFMFLKLKVAPTSTTNKKIEGKDSFLRTHRGCLSSMIRC